MTQANSIRLPLRLPAWFAALGLALSAAGCALIHHDTQPAAEIVPERIRIAGDIHLAREGWPAARWWTRYGDVQLNGLIDSALAQSPTIAIARSRLSRAHAQVELARASADLQVGARASIDRQHVSDNGFLSAYASHDLAIGATGPSYTSGLVGLDGRLDLDLWGRERAEIEAALGVQNANRADEAAAELEISTDVAQLYYSIQTTYASLDLLRQARDIAAFSVQAHAARQARGLEAQTPGQEAQADLLALDRRIASAQQQVVQSREALRALSGAGADDLASIEAVPLPEPAASLPGTLSYELLARRPDLQALRWSIEASFDSVDAAKAAFYPSFDINAFFGLDALHLADLFTHASQQINFIPGLYLPIFDGGRLNASLHGARSASDTLIEQYNQAVLDAVRDVAQTGSRLQDIAHETQLQVEKTDAVSFTRDSTYALYQRGLADKLAALQAQEPVIAEKLALLQLDGQELDQEITLIKELGGGYRSETPVVLSPR